LPLLQNIFVYEYAKNDLFLKALQGATLDRPPVWMMRQAGRYLPDFMKLKAKYDFFTRCQTPELAAEITVMPIDQIGTDAAILFSDILVVPQAMGVDVQMKPDIGPWLPNPVRTQADVDRVEVPDVHERLHYVMDGIRHTLERLDNEVPLIGFCRVSMDHLFVIWCKGKDPKPLTKQKPCAFPNPPWRTNYSKKLRIQLSPISRPNELPAFTPFNCLILGAAFFHPKITPLSHGVTANKS
jgi:uroporphyrinogen decarboxylase